MRNKALLVLLAAALALPASAQIDFTRFVQIGDSFTAGFMDGCWAEHGQRADYGAVLANLAGADFQQPLIKDPGVGTLGLGPNKGCLVLASLLPSPAFTRKESTLVLLNATLPRPYNNLAVPGYKIRDVTDTKSSADNGNPLTDVVLRGSGATVLQQAASLHPTFVTVWIGNYDVLGAIVSGTAIEGLTLTPMAVAAPKLQTIFDTLKASQGGNASGVAFTIPDLTAIPFTTAVSPVITVGGRTVNDPVTNTPMTYLSRKVEKLNGLPTGVIGPVAPIPAGSRLTLYAADYIKTGWGIPCSVFTAAGVPAGDPRRANCDKPLPDDLDPVSNTPGVVLYPDEVGNIQDRINNIDGMIEYLADGDGYKVFDTAAFYDDFRENGRRIGGISFTADFLSGGFFSYDAIHPSALGHAILARELVSFLNAEFRASLPDVDMSPYLAGVSGVGLVMPPDATLDAAASLWPVALWPQSRRLFGFVAPSVVGGDEEPPVRRDRERDWRH